MSILHAIFIDEYDIKFEASGKGIVSDEAFDYILDRLIAKYREECGREPGDVSLNIENSGFNGIDTAFLERFENIRELILPDSITEISMTDKLSKILTDNNTLIRGSFDSFAERFASDMELNFKPADFIIGRYVYEKTQETTLLTLQFRRDGSVQVRADIDFPGSSAGNNFGGVFYKELPSGFWLNMTAEEVSAMFPGTDDVVAKDGRLAEFIEKAKGHKIYTGKN